MDFALFLLLSGFVVIFFGGLSGVRLNWLGVYLATPFWGNQYHQMKARTGKALQGDFGDSISEIRRAYIFVAASIGIMAILPILFEWGS